MNTKNQQWYSAFAKGYLQNPGVQDKAFQQADRSMDNHLPLNFQSIYTMPEMPPSIRAAAEDFQAGEPYQRITGNVEVLTDLLPSDELVQAAATTPDSFYQRSLRQVLPQVRDNEVLFGGPYMGLYPSQRTDSVVGSLDDLFNFADPSNIDVQPGPSGLTHRDDCICHPSSLQYHLLTSRPVIERKESVTDVNDRYDFSHPTPSQPSSVNNSRKSTISCPYCPGKQYTGDWAARNLHRHMESVHAPCSSPDGVRHFVCSYRKCEKTFKREDARLVHERKSHPELNRPPPTKRKRSGEYEV